MSLACRAFLREALGHLLDPARAAHPEQSSLEQSSLENSHLEECAFCRARLAAGDHLASVLRERPKMPAEAEFAAVLERVHEQVVETYEASPLGGALTEVPEVPVESADAAAWELPVLGSELARRAISPPKMPSAAAWVRVRANILSEATNGPARRAPRLVIGLLGTLAAAGVVLLFVEWRPDRGPQVPHIEFADLQVMPAVDFAFLRHGVER